METSATRAASARTAWLRSRLQVWAAVVERQRGHMFPWVPVLLGIGMATYFALPFEPSGIHLASLAFVAAAAAAGSARLGVGAWIVALVLAGISIAGLRTQLVSAPVLEFRYYGPIEGRIVAIDRSNSGKTRLTLDQVRLDRVQPIETPARVRVSLHGDQRFLTPEPGMIVMMTGHLSTPPGPVEPGGFDFQRKAFFERLGAVGYTRSPALTLDPGAQDSFALMLYAFRKDLSAAIKARMGGIEGPFAAAIVTGDRTDLDAGALEDLRGSNLAHLLAISGLHMGLLTGAVFAVMRFGLAAIPRTPRRISHKKLAAFVALVAGLAYLGVSGASVATQRAFVMAAVMLTAVMLERRAISLRSVAVAAIFVLLISPESLTGPGFQMSFAATVALVAVFAVLRDTDWMGRLPRWSRPVATLVISSGIAGLATAPFGAAHFNQMAQYGLIANLLSVPIMGLVVMPGAIVAALLAPIGLDGIGLEIMSWGLAWILGVARVITDQAGAVTLIPAPRVWVLPLVALGGLVLAIWHGWGRLSGIAIIAAGLALWSVSSRPPFLLTESGVMIGVLGPEGRVLNKPKGDGFATSSWLENDADPADAATAAERSLGTGEITRKQAKVQIADHTVIWDVTKDLSPQTVAQHCARADLVLVPQFEGVLPCRGINKRIARTSGAVAIRADSAGLALVSSNALRGARPWVR